MKYLIINNPIPLVDIVLSYRHPPDAIFPQVYTNDLAVSLSHLWILAWLRGVILIGRSCPLLASVTAAAEFDIGPQE